MLAQLKTVFLIKEAIKRAFFRLVELQLCLEGQHPGVDSVVRNLQFLDNFSHGIFFISQNKNRLTSFLFLAILSL